MTERDELLGKLRTNTEHQKQLLLERSVLSDRLVEIVLAEDPTAELAPKTRTKSKAPDLDAIVKRYADRVPAESGCLCGCGEEVAEGSNFLKGHQNRLRSIVAAYDAARLPLSVVPQHAFDHIRESGWSTLEFTGEIAT